MGGIENACETGRIHKRGRSHDLRGKPAWLIARRNKVSILILTESPLRCYDNNGQGRSYRSILQYAIIGMPFYFCGQRAKRACLHAHLATAAGVNTPQLCCVASLMPRQLAAGLLTILAHYRFFSTKEFCPHNFRLFPTEDHLRP